MGIYFPCSAWSTPSRRTLRSFIPSTDEMCFCQTYLGLSLLGASVLVVMRVPFSRAGVLL